MEVGKPQPTLCLFYLHRMRLVGDIVTYFWSLHDRHSPLCLRAIMRTTLLAGECMWALDQYAKSPVPVGKCLCLWAALHKERRAWTCIETQSKNRVVLGELRVLMRKLQETRQWSCDLSFALGLCFVLLPGVAARRDFTFRLFITAGYCYLFSCLYRKTCVPVACGLSAICSLSSWWYTLLMLFFLTLRV